MGSYREQDRVAGGQGAIIVSHTSSKVSYFLINRRKKNVNEEKLNKNTKRSRYSMILY